MVDDNKYQWVLGKSAMPDARSTDGQNCTPHVNAPSTVEGVFHQPQRRRRWTDRSAPIRTRRWQTPSRQTGPRPPARHRLRLGRDQAPKPDMVDQEPLADDDEDGHPDKQTLEAWIHDAINARGAKQSYRCIVVERLHADQALEVLRKAAKSFVCKANRCARPRGLVLRNDICGSDVLIQCCRRCPQLT
ncbi:hypothetical protein [Bradyrhizobium genosp. SA-3]|uniref:hypothetical protein n=1 Tax=Bradyrhizobium genosp. SA-3 TaxID=508868 RepID=UPI001AC00045|nr:hypothetical protein [Bradyrhizobium genosp. SA-3]